MTNHLFLDLDGTLIDSSRRQHALFNELAPQSQFTYADYWRIKRRRISQKSMLQQYFHYSDAQAEIFHEAWIRQIEAPQRLATDTPFPGVTHFLRRAAERCTLCLATARQRPDAVAEQLNRFGWQGLFTHVFVTQQTQSKAALITAILSPERTDRFVGDTGEDIQAARELGVEAIAVSSGVLDADVLREYNPDRVLASVTELEIQ